jgi:hypothetical protein
LAIKTALGEGALAGELDGIIGVDMFPNSVGDVGCDVGKVAIFRG